jgi:hypothetical protein
MGVKLLNVTPKQMGLLNTLNPFLDHQVTYKEAALVLGVSETAIKRMMMRIKKNAPTVYLRFKQLRKKMNAGQRAIEKAARVEPRVLERLGKHSFIEAPIVDEPWDFDLNDVDDADDRELLEEFGAIREWF